MKVELVNFEDSPSWQVAAACRAAGPPPRRDATAPAACRDARDPHNAVRPGSRSSPVILVTGRFRFAGLCDRAGSAFRLGLSARSACHSRTAGQTRARTADAA
jgi:hypothetical protein